jgi:ribosomal-protein-alanine N-acetyltransferase
MPAMMEIERESGTTAHWSQEQYENVFLSATNGQGSQRFAWVVEDEAQQEGALTAASQIYGFLVAHGVERDWELENMVVTETARRRGFASLLLNELMAHAQSQNGSVIFLEVRGSNQGARALYERAGFKKDGLRKSYYSNPLEDAILYRLSLY